MFVFGYIFLIWTTFRWAKRKTNSFLKALFAVLILLVLTFGDSAFNRWYRKEILCKRDDVGVKVFKVVAVPAEEWNSDFARAEIDLKNTRQSPFLGRYVIADEYTSGGWFPLTSYYRHEYAIIDTKTEKPLARAVNYEPSGGLWWTFPLALLGEKSLVGWLSSRGHSPGCFESQNSLGLLDIIHGAFTLSKNKVVE